MILCITGLCLCHVVYAQAVIQCAYTLDGWNKASVSLQYQKPKYYHCLTDEFGHFIQKCSQRILVPKGISEFTIQLNIKKIPCQSKQKFAFSWELHKQLTFCGMRHVDNQMKMVCNGYNIDIFGINNII